jgi:molybdopterin/thiamine biosynthesis adenylyltransferase
MLSNEEKERYDRQLLIDDLGVKGQEKLKKSKVFIAGAGGLGSPISIYLSAAGVGTLRIVDQDIISLSNMNRQILYNSMDIGKKKAHTAKEKLKALNPHINVEVMSKTITKDNVFDLVDGFDLIMDAMDNFPTRYLLNEAAFKKNIPFIYGGVYGLEGVLTTMIPGKTVCLRCIVNDAPPASTPPPVLGSTPGIIGCLQSMEAIKYLSGMGSLLTNRLMIFDGFNMQFREVKLSRDLKCTLCAQN